MQMVDRLTEKASERLVEAARSASDNVVEAAGGAVDYVRRRGFRRMGRDLSKFVSRNPVQAMLAMTAVGFLTGLLIRRR